MQPVLWYLRTLICFRYNQFSSLIVDLTSPNQKQLFHHIAQQAYQILVVSQFLRMVKIVKSACTSNTPRKTL